MYGLGFGVGRGVVGAHAGAGHGEGRGGVAVLFGGDVGRVIGQHEQPPFGICLQLGDHRADDVKVDGFDGRDFCLPVRLVAGLVGAFDVADDQVVLVQRRRGGRALAGVIGVVEAGHAGHFGHVPAEQNG